VTFSSRGHAPQSFARTRFVEQMQPDQPSHPDGCLHRKCRNLHRPSILDTAGGAYHRLESWKKPNRLVPDRNRENV
jgi:hypothetical protein